MQWGGKKTDKEKEEAKKEKEVKKEHKEHKDSKKESTPKDKNSKKEKKKDGPIETIITPPVAGSYEAAGVCLPLLYSFRPSSVWHCIGDNAPIMWFGIVTYARLSLVQVGGVG